MTKRRLSVSRVPTTPPKNPEKITLNQRNQLLKEWFWKHRDDDIRNMTWHGDAGQWVIIRVARAMR